MSSNVIDPKEDFYSAINIEKSSIKLRPSTILIFGGAIDVKILPCLSVREKIVEYSAKNFPDLFSSIVIPEDFKDWASDAKYSDLLEFETHIGQMSTKIVLIPESPGSIAELGAFVVNKHVSQKLMVILPTEHFNVGSFINLGLLKQLEDEQTFAYDYPANNFNSTIDTCIEDIVLDIETQAKSGISTEGYDSKNFGHRAFCIFQLIQDCQALRISEIETLLIILDINFERDDLKKALYLLDKLKFIVLIRVSNSSFYLINPLRKGESRVSYSGQDNAAHIDVLSFRIELAQYYKNAPTERPRRRAIEQSMQAPEL